MQAQVEPYEDTEVNDALRARGMIPAKPPSRSPTPEAPEASEVRAANLKRATVADLDDEIDALENANDDEEERRLLALRRQRLNDLMRERKRGKFGRVYPITRPDYTREVTEASKEQQEGGEAEGGVEREGEGEGGGEGEGEAKAKGTGVVCFLYKDGMETCKLVAGYLDTLAEKYPSSKFVSIVGDKCIPNYPDRNLPTLIIYRNGELHRQIVGLRPEIGLDGLKTKYEDVELLLLAVGAIERSRVPGGETYARDREDGRNDEDDGDDDEDEGFGGSRRKTKPAIRSQEDEDADLDWDL